MDSLRNDMIDALRKLVSIPGVTGDEGQTQDFMRRNYDALGLEVRVLCANRTADQIGRKGFLDSLLCYLPPEASFKSNKMEPKDSVPVLILKDWEVVSD
jgi:hypothetical protein